MARTTLTIDRLFDRSSRLPYPLRARTSPGRRWCMMIIFILLSTTIGVYWFLTDARRVRDMAEQYLTQLSGARVSIGRATLSIFEGLRLDDVRLFAEQKASVDPKSIRALPIFSATRFQITYNLRSMLRGKLEATRIVATNPRVLVAEDVDEGRWNYQRLTAPTPELPTTPGQPLQLPEIILRDAQVDYIEVRHGVKSAIGSMSIEGHLSANAMGDHYQFNLQSRGITQGVGPSVSGSIDVATGQVYAQLRNFTFGRDIKTMLPALVRTWWEQHELSGRVDVPLLSFTPPSGNRPAAFKVETELDAVSLAVHPNEWMSHDEIVYLQYLRDGLELLDNAYRSVGVYDGSIPTPTSLSLESLRMEPVRLQKVSGTFVFTEKGIEIRDAGARIENNSFALSGRIDGYSPDSPLALSLSSRKSENLVIPAAPRYLNSMPQPVRELYTQLKPSGECRLAVQVHRDEPGERIIASGEVEVVDGNFQFIKFPYPVREAHGKIEFGPDPRTGIERLELTDLRGKGVLGGPNENSVMILNGHVAPLGPDAALQIYIRGDRVLFEEDLRRSFPPPVRKIIKNFEAPGHEGSLKFEGGFLCEIFRSEGFDRDVLISTDLRLDDASGVLADFPYPLQHVKGLVQIRDEHVDIVDVRCNDGAMNLKVSGRVSWVPFHERDGQDPDKTPHPPLMLRSDIKVVANNIPVDAKLLAALPAKNREMLEKVGITGRLDVDGMLTQRPLPMKPGALESDSPVRYDLAIKLHDAAVKPPGQEWSIDKIDSDLQVSSDMIRVKQLTGSRNKAKITGSGSCDLTVEHPIAVANVSAVNLELDQPFYKLVTKGTQEVWDLLRPTGAVDLHLSFHPDASHAFAMTMRPRGLIIQPTNFPIKMDQFTGEVRVADDVLTFDNVQAHSGDASMWLSGTTRMEKRDWDIRFAARGLVLNDELVNALPASLKGLIGSIGLKGQVAVDFDKLRITDAAAPAGPPPSTQPADPNALPDIEFAATLWLNDASFNIGVPISKATGRLKLASSIHQGHLEQIDGSIEAWALQMAGRDVTNFSAKLLKRPDETGLRLDEMQATVADGTLGGRIDLITSETGASKYVMNVSVRNADVAQLTQETDTKIEGRLSASLALEGPWGDTGAVRGRGDVLVNGKQIAKLPLLLGLFQIANLTLPISGPLNDATVKYSIDGPIVTFDRIELKGNNVMMTGDGRLNFTKKTVDMRFSTENPNAFQIPLIGPLLESANRELLQIHVRGSILAPKVSSSSFGTISTTVDEVLNGDNDGPEKKK